MKKIKIVKSKFFSVLTRLVIVILLVITYGDLTAQNTDWLLPNETRAEYLERLKRPGKSREVYLNKKRDSIKTKEYVVLGRVVERSFCFYSNEPYDLSPKGKRIYTAAKIQIIHDYKGNMNVDSGYFLIVQPGGKIGKDSQKGIFRMEPVTQISYDMFGFGFTRGMEGPVLLFLLDKSMVEMTSKDYHPPIYGISTVPTIYSVQDEDDADYMKRLGFQTDVEFDKFIYKTLGLKRNSKKKDVGSRDFLIEPTWMKITGIQYPTGSGGKIHAGTREILTILGTDFGSQKGNILFRDADHPFVSNIPNGPPNYLKGLDHQYIESWADTKIEVLVPSFVGEGHVSGVVGRSAGSGRIRVQKPIGKKKWKTVTSPTSVQVNIEYSILNSTVDGNIISNIPNYTRQIHAQRYCINGMVFTDSSQFVKILY